MKTFALLTVVSLATISCSLPPSAQDQVHQHHSFNYIELTVADMDAAKRFYSGAFGWEFNDYGPDYAGIKVEGREVAGLAVGDPRPRGGPLVVLYSNDLDATAVGVRSAGGTISKEPFDFPGGRRFHFVDPAGNELAVWSER